MVKSWKNSYGEFSTLQACMRGKENALFKMMMEAQLSRHVWSLSYASAVVLNRNFSCPGSSLVGSDHLNGASISSDELRLQLPSTAYKTQNEST